MHACAPGHACRHGPDSCHRPGMARLSSRPRAGARKRARCACSRSARPQGRQARIWPLASPPWQRRMNSRLNSLEQVILGGSARPTASSERRCLGSSSANIPLRIDKPSLPGLAARFYLTINLGVRNAGSRSGLSDEAPPRQGHPPTVSLRSLPCLRSSASPSPRRCSCPWASP